MVRRMLGLILMGLCALQLNAQKPISLTDKVPFNPDVLKGKLENGIPDYIMKNARPANRLGA